jgi:hypothetical protein
MLPLKEVLVALDVLGIPEEIEKLKTQSSGGGSFVVPPSTGGVAIETDPVFTAWLATDPLAGYLTAETDPTFTAWLGTVTPANWDTAYSWGNHANAGYLTGITSLQVTTALGYTPVTNARTLTINGTSYDLTANRSWTISADNSFGTTTQIPYMNAGGTDFLYGAGLTYDGTYLLSPSIIGSSAADGDITIQGTSSATKTSSYVNLQPTGGNVGIGTTAPTQKLTIDNDDGVSNGEHHGMAFRRSSSRTTVLFGYLADGTTDTGGFIRTGNVAGTDLRLGTASTPDAMMIKSNGNVGIGTITSGVKLTIEKDDGVSNGEHSVMTFQRSASRTTVLFGYLANGATDIGGFIRTGNIMGTDLQIGTASTPDAVMIKSDGNVGIGTTTPGEKLHIIGNTLLNDNGKALFGTGKDSSILYDGTNMVFNSREVGTGNFIFSGGNVGIGTTSPTSALTINPTGENGLAVTWPSAGAYPWFVKEIGLYIGHGNSYANGYGYLYGVRGDTGARVNLLEITTSLKALVGFAVANNAFIGTFGALGANMNLIGTTSASLIQVGSDYTYTTGGQWYEWPMQIFYGSELMGAPGFLKFTLQAHGAKTDVGYFNNVGNFGINTTTPGEKLEVNGNIQLTADNNILKFGTGEDAHIYYDATNLIINPKVVGTGYVSILGGLKTAGNRITGVTTVTDTYNVLATDETVICNKTTAFTVTLPTGVVGQIFHIKNINTGVVTVSLAGDTIDGETSQTLNQWDCMKVQCRASNIWIII